MSTHPSMCARVHTHTHTHPYTHPYKHKPMHKPEQYGSKQWLLPVTWEQWGWGFKDMRSALSAPDVCMWLGCSFFFPFFVGWGKKWEGVGISLSPASWKSLSIVHCSHCWLLSTLLRSIYTCIMLLHILWVMVGTQSVKYLSLTWTEDVYKSIQF